jgi:hypothetical protein
MISRNMSDHLNEIHVRIRFNHNGPSTVVNNGHSTMPYEDGEERVESDELVFASDAKHSKNGRYDEEDDDESSGSTEQTTIKLRYCKSILKDEDKLTQYNFFEHAHREQQQPLTGQEYEEASLTDENVVTFFDSKINQRLQCISILLANNSLGIGKRPVYCLKMKNCVKRLPFICKFESPVNKALTSKTRTGGVGSEIKFYPDTLRNYQQDPKMSFVINSFLAVVYGLDRVHQKVCKKKVILLIFISN